MEATKVLHKFYQISLQPCVYLGMTIFSLDSGANLHFSLESWPIRLVVLRMLVILAVLMRPDMTQQIFDMLFGIHSGTEDFSTMLFTFSILVENVAWTCFLFRNRQNFMSFHEKLTQCLVDLAYNSKCGHNKKFYDLMEAVHWKVKVLRNVVLALFFYAVIVLPVILFMAMRKIPELWSIDKALPLFFVCLFWLAGTALQFLPRVWVTSILHCLTTYVVLIQDKITHQDNHFEEIFKFCKNLEEIVECFNNSTGYLAAVDLLSLFITKVIIFFMAGTQLLVADIGPFVSNSMLFLVDIFILFTLFNESNQFQVETRKLAGLLKNVDRKLIMGHTQNFRLFMQLSKWLNHPLSIMPGSFFPVNRTSWSQVHTKLIINHLICINDHNLQ